MPEYETNLRGIISKNTDKKDPKHADYSGKCEIEGTEYYMDGWINHRNDGSGSFLSIRFKPKSNVAPQQPAESSSLGDADNPF